MAKSVNDLAFWINSILEDYFCRYDPEANQLIVFDGEDGDEVYWFDLDDFEL